MYTYIYIYIHRIHNILFFYYCYYYYYHHYYFFINILLYIYSNIYIYIAYNLIPEKGLDERNIWLLRESKCLHIVARQGAKGRVVCDARDAEIQWRLLHNIVDSHGICGTSQRGATCGYSHVHPTIVRLTYRLFLTSPIAFQVWTFTSSHLHVAHHFYLKVSFCLGWMVPVWLPVKQQFHL